MISLNGRDKTIRSSRPDSFCKKKLNFLLGLSFLEANLKACVEIYRVFGAALMIGAD